jgi:hypothetical protein
VGGTEALGRAAAVDDPGRCLADEYEIHVDVLRRFACGGDRLAEVRRLAEAALQMLGVEYPRWTYRRIEVVDETTRQQLERARAMKRERDDEMSRRQRERLERYERITRKLAAHEIGRCPACSAWTRVAEGIVLPHSKDVGEGDWKECTRGPGEPAQYWITSIDYVNDVPSSLLD